uniref:Uncharacterized protein n=1 Tax=Aegilops tauschii TaxID=37682 RepID=N1R2M5_AEGTA
MANSNGATGAAVVLEAMTTVAVLQMKLSLFLGAAAVVVKATRGMVVLHGRCHCFSRWRKTSWSPPEVDSIDSAFSRKDFELWLCKRASQAFEADFSRMDTKIHRFPDGMKNLGGRYIVPMVVAMGPYHCNLRQLQAMEEVKRVAAYQFVSSSSGSFEEICAAILPVAVLARSLYDFVVAGDTDDLKLQGGARGGVRCKDGTHTQVRKEKEREEFDLGDGYKPPHLLGLLRFYKTRHTLQVPPKKEQKLLALGSSSASEVPTSDQDGQISMSKNISAIELAEIGIKLMASKTTKLVDMGMEKRPLSGNIFLAPLLLDDIRSCWLVNMAALEVCLAAGVRDDEKPVVCSYLALLAMLMDREEDVPLVQNRALAPVRKGF